MVRYAFVFFSTSIALAAVAQQPDAEPRQQVEKLDVLIVDGQNNHRWRETTPILRAVLEQSGRFAVSVATSPQKGQDLAAFAPKFTDYDVVVSNYNGQLWPQATRAAFASYVRSGGGFVSVHAANNAFPGWSEYNRIIGLGGWGRRSEKDGPYVRWRDGEIVRDTQPGRGGSHGKRHAFALDVRAPEHPIVKGLPMRWMHAKDELYDRLRGPAEELTVLATAFADKSTGGSGEHEPLLMTIGFGEGRVFHTALGHDANAMACVGFQATLLRGVEWAATGEVTIAIPEDFPGSESVVKRDPLGWISLFDGKSLGGWTQQNGTATYRVENGAIVGQTADGSPNSFLCTDRAFADFELEFEVKVHARLNSGVQLRSASLPEFKKGRVHGPQVEIEASPGEAGHFYSEGTGRGWLSPKQHLKDPKRREAFRNGKWNRYRVRAVGPRLQSWINGVAVGDVIDAKSRREGFIGLQVHSIRRGAGPWEVRWRRIRLREIRE